MSRIEKPEPVGRESGCQELLAALMRAEIPALVIQPDSRVEHTATGSKVILPGSFNPVHEGHWRMAAVAAQRLGHSAAFELSVSNVDKPMLSLEAVQNRVAQFAGRAPIWLTRAPTFLEKARLFPGAVFIVGADTAARIPAIRYYQDNHVLRDEALAQIRNAGCRFLVCPRLDPSGVLVGVEELDIPDAFAGMFVGVPKAEFCVAVSSTELRNAHSSRRECCG